MRLSNVRVFLEAERGTQAPRYDREQQKRPFQIARQVVLTSHAFSFVTDITPTLLNFAVTAPHDRHPGTQGPG